MNGMNREKFYNNFWRLVKVKMDVHGYSIADTAKRAGLTRTSLSMALKNKSRTELHTFLKLCEVLEIPPFKVTTSLYKHFKEIPDAEITG